MYSISNVLINLLLFFNQATNFQRSGQESAYIISAHKCPIVGLGPSCSSLDNTRYKADCRVLHMHHGVFLRRQLGP